MFRVLKWVILVYRDVYIHTTVGVKVSIAGSKVNISQTGRTVSVPLGGIETTNVNRDVGISDPTGASSGAVGCTNTVDCFRTMTRLMAGGR